MLYSNYQELIDSVVNWNDRQDFLPHMPEFVRMVTVDATRDLRVPTMEKIWYFRLSNDGGFNIPSDFVQAISLSYITFEGEEIVTNKPLYRSSPLKLKESFEVKDKEPRSFCRQADRFIIFPYKGNGMVKVFSDCDEDKESEDGVELVYYALPAPMENPEDCNWLLAVAPDIYFYGCMMHTARFIRDMDSANYWEGKYKEAKTQLQGMSNIADQAGGSWMVGDDYYEYF